MPTPQWLSKIREDVAVNTLGGLKAPMPSLVVDVKVKPDDKVVAGQAVVVLESMKTEIVLRAEKDGVVTGVMCKAGEMVAEGKELVSIGAS
jgi:3-methylcrotonyl-CoA carboxylase alpha subunit